MPFGDFSDHLAEIRLYEPDADGNVRFSGDVKMTSDMNVVIPGHLIVDGNLELDCEGMGNFMFVSGNVEAKCIVVCGVSSMNVRGNIHSTHGILGCYGDDGGYLSVAGTIDTPVILNTTYFNMHLRGETNAVVIDISYGDMETEYDDEMKAAAILHPDFASIDTFDHDDYEFDPVADIDVRKIYQALVTGQSVLNA